MTSGNTYVLPEENIFACQEMHVFIYASYPYKKDYNKGCALLLYCMLRLYVITFKMWADTAQDWELPPLQEASVAECIPVLSASGSLCLALLQGITNKLPAKERQWLPLSLVIPTGSTFNM